jgi:phosphate transport system protein
MSMLEERMISLKKRLIEYASLVESMVNKSLAGLQNKDKTLLTEVLQNDEPLANNFDIELDATCTNLIAQYQPQARNLRILLMILRMSTDLERMGDHAVNIVESSLFLIERQPVKPLVDLPKMGEITRDMLKDGINSFINEDAPLAKTVCERDNLVDDLKDKINFDLMAIMSKDPATIERSLHLLRIAGNLERIADLSTNICEDVMYMVEGRVIKHHLYETQDQDR